MSRETSCSLENSDKGELTPTSKGQPLITDSPGVVIHQKKREACEKCSEDPTFGCSKNSVKRLKNDTESSNQNSNTSEVNDVLQKFMSNQLIKKTLKNTGIQTELFLPESAHHCNGNPIKNSIEMLTKQNQELLDNIEHLNSQSQNHKLSLSKSIEITKKLLIEKSELERKTTQQNCSENSLTLGRFVMQRYGSSYSEVWHSGTRQKQLLNKQKYLAAEKEDLEKQKRQLLKRKASINSNLQQMISQNSTNNSNSGGGNNSSNSNPDPSYFSEQQKLIEVCEAEELLKIKFSALRKEDNDISIDLERVERERLLHSREINRLHNQDNSRFNNYPILNKRYLVLVLIGKGGFSEVHKAFDLIEQRYVACKIHQLNNDWKEERKANYIRHAVREYEIHKKLDHPRIVKLYDVFEIDTNAFCTVLEYVDGPDLDFFLKQNRIISERESRAIISQLINALKYLNELPNPVIHYDLKPANILLESNFTNSCTVSIGLDSSHIISPVDIKITDFGLSKIVEMQDCESSPGAIELTSQGAGTYWYLPPETFITGSRPPKISSKVDVWSVGIIFYQILYGVKPFAHDMSQTAILEQQAILNQAKLTLRFPNKPVISAEAKNFIKKCLVYDDSKRPDVISLANDEYLKPSTYKNKQIPEFLGSNTAGSQVSSSGVYNDSQTSQDFGKD